jgi:hypothetical protein
MNGMKDMANRRNILTIIGLAGASTAAVAAEQFDSLSLEPSRVLPGLMRRSRETQERIASALENMARAIRNGELAGIRIEVNSVASFDEWMTHEVRVQCELSAPEATS